MASSIIGQLRVILGLDTAAFEKGLTDAERQMSRAGRSFEQIGRRIEGVGKTLSIGLTLPIVAIGGASLKMAANFESSMNRVEAATGASGAQLKALRDQAKAFGADRGVTATAAQTADVMEALAKNGLSAQQILDGTTGSVLRLAAANGAEFAPAADLTTDIMQQFGKRASDMSTVVDKLTGGMLVSKFGFDDYRLAIGQTGGVAGGLGQTFEDTNVAIAATSALFASGSDAGTSYKTFLTSLTPKSKEAGEMMKKLGLDFFDATGKIKPLADVSQMLRDKLGGLADEAKNEALKTIFGTDAMRTAIGLMNQGADGIMRIRTEIDKASASDQMEARMKGWSGAIVQVQKAFESASIALGDSGFLAGLTSVAISVADLIRAFASLPSPVLTAIGVFAGVAAAVGPVVFVTGKLVGVWGTILTLVPRLRTALGTVAVAEAAAATGATGAAASMGVLEGAMAFLAAGGWPIVIGAIAIALGVWAVKANEAGPATQAAQKALDDMNAAHRVAEPVIRATASATHTATDEMEAAIVKARDLATALYGVAAGAKAASLELAKQQYNQAKARFEQVQNEDTRSLFGKLIGAPINNRTKAADIRAGQADVAKAKQTMDRAHLAYQEQVLADNFPYKRAPVATPVAPTSNPNLSLGDGGKPKKATGPHGPTPEELARRKAEIQLEVELQAAQDRGDTTKAQALQDQLDLQRRIKDYEGAGLKADAARAAAAADMNTLITARAEAMAREIATDQRQMDIQIAQLTGNGQMVKSLQSQADLAERITYWRQHGLDLEKATAAAIADQVKLDAARAAQHEHSVADAESQRQIDLARARGDSEDQIRTMEQADAARRRSWELQNDPVDPKSKAEADAQAMSEAMEMEQARQQGIFRDTIRGGFRAALDGNLGDWFKNWWKDRVAKGMEEALNSLSDLIFKLFSNAGSGSGGGGLNGIIGAIGSIFSGGATANSLSGASLSSMGRSVHVTGFATGGSFKVGGRAGIDQNLVQFRATAGEMVNVTRPGQNDNGPVGSTTNVFHNDFRGADAAAVPRIEAKLDELDRSLEGRSVAAVGDAMDRRILRRGGF